MTGSERIFISYSTTDGKPFADALRERTRRLRTFQSGKTLSRLKAGRDWWSQIENALKSKALQHFILVVTPGALASPIVRREIRFARQEGKTVSPVQRARVSTVSMRCHAGSGRFTIWDIPEQRKSLMRAL